MEDRTLGDGLRVSALGLGCMGMSEFYGPRDDAQSLRVLDRAIELGVTFLDTADTYGAHHNEELIGRFVRNRRADIVIATKFGIVRKPGRYARAIDNSPEYVRQACEGSLRRLGVEKIDLLYVHRHDPGRPIEEVVGSVAELIREGKVGHIGLCEVNADTLRRAHSVHPIAALQTEYSLWTRHVEREILPTCRELGIGFVPYSPLGRGFLTGTFDSETQFEEDDFRASLPRFAAENRAVNLRLVSLLRDIAAQVQCTPSQLALSWLLRRGLDVVPIPGTKRIERLDENCGAVGLRVPDTLLSALDRGVCAHGVAGARYTDEGMKGVEE